MAVTNADLKGLRPYQQEQYTELDERKQRLEAGERGMAAMGALRGAEQEQQALMGAGQRYRGFGGGALQQQVAGQSAQVGQMGALAASDLDAQELQDIDLQQKQLRQIGQEQAYILEQQRKEAEKAGRNSLFRGLSSIGGSILGGLAGIPGGPMGILTGASVGAQMGGTAYDTFSDEDLKMAAGIPDKDIEEFLKKSATPGKFKYKPGVTGPDASPARVGTTTARMKQSELGKQMVREQGGVETLPGNNPTPQDMSTIIASLGYLYRQMEKGKKNG